jgi:T4-like virus tail tube protein gp19
MSTYENAPISHWLIAGGDFDGVNFIQSVSEVSDSTPAEGVAFQDANGNPVTETWFSRQVPTGEITVRRLLDTSGTFAEARTKVKNGEYEKTEITLTAKTAAGDDIKTISLTGAWPSAHTLSAMDSNSNEQAYETLTFTYDTMEIT